MRRFASTFTLVLALCTPHAVSADPDPEAQRLLDEGTRLFTDEAAHEAARAAFQRSYELEPSWRALNGVALTYQEQGRYVEALDTYEQMLREFDATLSTTQRETAEKRIAALEAKIARIEITAEQATTIVSIDNREIGTAPMRRSVRVMPGRHVLVATRDGYRTFTRALEVTSGQRFPLAIVLQEENVVVRTQPAVLARRWPTWLPWATIGGGAALLGTAGLFHLAASASFDAFDKSIMATAGSPPMPVRGDTDARDRGELENRIAIGCAVVGVAVAISGAVFLAINQPRPVDVVPTANGVAVLGRF